LHPDKTKFLAISMPREPAPLRKMFAAACLVTASTPIAPMYLDHLSLTASSFTSKFNYLVSIINDSSSSDSMSIINDSSSSNSMST
jgi:hypothetical protein